MEKVNRKSLYADISMIVVALIWGSSFVVTKNVLDHITPLYMLAFRFIIASALLILIFFKKVKKTKRDDLTAGFIIGIFLFLAFLAQTVGIEYTTAGKNAFITASNVVIVPFLYWLTSRKKPNIYEVIGAILCFVGIGVLSLDANLTIGLGDLLTLIGGFFYACHIVAVGYYSKKHDPILLTIFQFSVTAILSLIFALIFEPKVSSVTGEMIFPIVYLALFSTLIGFLIQNVAQKYTSSTHAAIILSMESVFGNIFSIIFLKEALSVRLFIGCLLILISVITTETKWSFLRKEIAEK